jgi:hypothetical protein
MSQMDIKMELKSPIVIIVIIFITIIVIALIYFVYKFLFQNKSDIDNKKIATALKAGNIGTPTSENFYEDIVFDSKEKLNNNFEKFLQIYCPSVDISKISALLKEDGVNKSIDNIIKDNKIDALLFYMSVLEQLILHIYAENNKTNIILFGLSILIINKIMSRDGIERYYLNDYDTQKEFIIYSIPNTYKIDISNISKLSTDENIKLNNVFNVLPDNTRPYKFSLFNMLKERNIKPVVAAVFQKKQSDITEDDVNKYLSIIKDNNNGIKNLLNHQFAIILLMINNPNINETAKIFKTAVNNYSNLTDKFNEMFRTSLVTTTLLYDTQKSVFNERKGYKMS